MGNLIAHSHGQEMTISVPDLCDGDVRLLSTCGVIRTKDKALHKVAADHSETWHTYHVSKPSGTILVRVSLDSEKDYIHFHIEIATKDWFPKGKVPKPSKEAKPLNELLAPFQGQSVEVEFAAEFQVSVDRLPAFVHAVQGFSITQDGVSVKMTGGLLSVEGAPISRIQWFTKEESKQHLAVVMMGSAVLLFANTYFIDCLRRVTSYSDTFIKKEPTDA